MSQQEYNLKRHSAENVLNVVTSLLHLKWEKVSNGDMLQMCECTVQYIVFFGIGNGL